MMKDSNAEQSINRVEKIASEVEGKVALLTTQDYRLDGKHFTISGKQLINFGSCSYLGLELDQRLKEAAIDAILRYGSQFASSRAYVSVTLYEEAESMLSELFEQPVILGPTVTLGHQSNIPLLVENNDAVLIDSRAHESIQTSVRLLELRNVHLQTVRHNSINQIEDQILKLKGNYRHIWYLADGVYSMHGDYAPMNDLKTLLDRYEQFHLYVDDAHGMGWAGKNGSGYVRSQVPMHPRIYMITSLAKSFAANGCAMVFPNKEIRERIRKCGNTMIFSGPLVPPILGSLIASAKIHLSEEIYVRQRNLQRLISFFNNTAKLYNLPLFVESTSPICYIGAGKTGVGFNLAKRLFKNGFYINLAVFPSVPVNQSGLRIPITLHHTFEDIEQLLSIIATELPLALEEEGSSLKEIERYFKIKLNHEASPAEVPREVPDKP